MIEIKYNVFDKYESIPCEEILCSAMISSADKTSCDVMYNILTEVFQNNKMIFRAIGLPHNMEDVLKIFENCNPKLFEGDSRKFYIRKYPELHAEISDKSTLKKIFHEWANAITEQRIIYVLKEGQTDKVLSMLEKNVYDDRSHFSVLWPHWNCIIETVPEAEKDNTFILIFREEYLDRIKGFLNQVIS